MALLMMIMAQEEVRGNYKIFRDIKKSENSRKGIKSYCKSLKDS